MKKSLTYNWTVLLCLTGMHFITDFMAGMLPPLMPAIRERFMFSLVEAAILLGTSHLVANMLQAFIGHFRDKKTTPLLMLIGPIFASSICLMIYLNPSDTIFYQMMLLIVFSGIGIAITHPEALRSLHSIEGIQPSLATAVFLSGGFGGFSVGGIISTKMVADYGFASLQWLIVLPIVLVAILLVLKIKLSIEGSSPAGTLVDNRISFWPIFAVATFTCITTTMIMFYVPAQMKILGLELVRGGEATMAYGGSGAFGSFLWAYIAHRKGDLKTASIAVLLGVPLLILYLPLMQHHSAVFILAMAGLCSSGSFPIMVAAARKAKGLNIGQRMGFMVGGAWGIGSLVYMSFAKVAETYGIILVLYISIIGYIAAGILGLYVVVRNKNVKI